MNAPARANEEAAQSLLLAYAEELSDLLPVGVLGLDAMGTVVHANQHWAGLVGVENAVDLRGRSWDASVHASERSRVVADWHRAAREGLPFAAVFRTAGGEQQPVRWVRMRIAPVSQPLGPVKFAAVAADASRSVRSAQELAARNAHLAEVLEHLPCGLSVHDSGLQHVATNAAARRLLAAPDGSLPDDPAIGSLARQVRETSHAGDMSVAGEVTLADGRAIALQARRLPDGGVVIAYDDVTHSREARAQLETGRQRLARALDAAGLGLWEYDLVRQELHLAGGAARLPGWPTQDRVLAASSLVPLLLSADAERFRSAWHELLKGDTDRMSVEHRVEAAHGQELWLLTEAQVSERDAPGQALRVVGTCRDVTDRKKADASIQASAAAAAQANQAKSDFLATMSHEIRTPLHGVIGFTQLLSMAGLPATERDAVAMIDNCAKSLLAVVDNILDFSRIEAGALELHAVPTDLAQMARELADQFGVRASGAGLRFQLELDPALPAALLVDPGRLRQILLNLLGNALKFTSSGSFSLAVHVHRCESAAEIRLEVADTGIGVAEHELTTLFERFTQGHDAAPRKSAGAGLGLAISRKLARLMGGDISVRSAAGQGSRFTLRLPLQEPNRILRSPGPAASPVRADAEILLAEDNEVSRVVATALLGRLGYRRITTAADGREVVAACARRAFDLILMDCRMPEMDGLEATRTLRSRGVETPVLAFTASATTNDRARCLAAGMDDYLTKPVELAVLAQKLRQWLAPSPGGRCAPEPAEEARPAFAAGVLDRMFRGDGEAFGAARAVFVKQTPALLDRMRDAVLRGDLPEARFVAHKIRGGALTLGAQALAQACRDVEEDREGAGTSVLDAVEAAQQGYARFVQDSAGACS